VITSALRQSDPGPSHWSSLKPGQTLAQLGLYDSQFVFYQAKLSGVETNLFARRPAGDDIIAALDQKPAVSLASTSQYSIFGLPSTSGHLVLLYENHGHANGGSAMEEAAGIFAAHTAADARDREQSVIVRHDTGSGGLELPAIAPGRTPVRLLRFGSPSGVEGRWWEPDLDDRKWKKVQIGSERLTPQRAALLFWYRLKFKLPKPIPAVEAALRLQLDASGNGFLYLNSQPIGRYWENGPQHDFFLPACWLKVGRENVLTLSLRPTGKPAEIRSAIIEPYDAL
jgi:hypothetical protein